MSRYLIITLLFLSLLSISCEDLILGPDLENTPENNFEILWNEFDRYYPAFILKGINWDSLYSVYRPLVNSQTTEDELWVIISQMLLPFNDIHVYMYNREHTRLFVSSTSFLEGSGEFSLPLVKTVYLNNNYHIIGQGKLTYGRFPGDSIGYLHIADFSTNTEWVEDINTVINELSDVKAMVIDIRDSRGGYESNCRYIASSFINNPVTYIQEITRIGPKHTDLSEPAFVTITHNKLHYDKRTIILTDRQTVSASEAFGLVFKYLPNSEQIGDFTAGALGSSHRRFQLLNGWAYHMPTSLCLTAEGQSLEEIGLAPDIYVRNSPKELYKGYDRILEFTLEHLSK